MVIALFIVVYVYIIIIITLPNNTKSLFLASSTFQASATTQSVISIEDDSTVVSAALKKVAAAGTTSKKNAFDVMKGNANASDIDAFKDLGTMPLRAFFFELVMQRISLLGDTVWCTAPKQVQSKAKKLYNLSLELIVENKKAFIVD